MERLAQQVAFAIQRRVEALVDSKNQLERDIAMLKVESHQLQ